MNNYGSRNFVIPVKKYHIFRKNTVLCSVITSLLMMLRTLQTVFSALNVEITLLTVT